MKLIIGKDVKSLFLAEWRKYVPAIIDYSKKSGKKAVLRRTFDLDSGMCMYTIFTPPLSLINYSLFHS